MVNDDNVRDAVSQRIPNCKTNHLWLRHIQVFFDEVSYFLREECRRQSTPFINRSTRRICSEHLHTDMVSASRMMLGNSSIMRLALTTCVCRCSLQMRRVLRLMNGAAWRLRYSADVVSVMAIR